MFQHICLSVIVETLDFIKNLNNLGPWKGVFCEKKIVKIFTVLILFGYGSLPRPPMRCTRRFSFYFTI